MLGNKPTNIKPTISITNELITHYVLSVFVILSCVLGLMYWAMLSGVRAQSVKFMKGEIHTVQALLNEKSAEALQRGISVTHENEYAKMYVRIIEKNGTELIETPAMATLLPSSLFKSPVPIESAITHTPHRVKVNGAVFLIDSLWLHVVGEPKVLQIGLDVTNIEKINDTLLAKLLFILLLGILVSGLAGRYIMRKGLRPILQIAAKSREITAGNLGERFISENWPVEMHDLTLALDGMLDRLQDSFERLSHFSANLAHELRTPIGNLMGEAEITLARVRTIDEYERILESSLEEYKRLSKIIDSLLFLGWADSRELKLKLEAVKVNEEIHNLHDYYADYAQGRAFMILCDANVTVWSDAVLFRRALSNIIMNAIRYSPEGKFITIRVEKCIDHVEISVSDQGVGISQEHLTHLFDRFYRVPSSSSLYTKGSGLGLSIVKSIMELHGGSVSIVSEPGIGTEIILSFPNNEENASC